MSVQGELFTFIFITPIFYSQIRKYICFLYSDLNAIVHFSTSLHLFQQKRVHVKECKHTGMIGYNHVNGIAQT